MPQYKRFVVCKHKEDPNSSWDLDSYFIIDTETEEDLDNYRVICEADTLEQAKEELTDYIMKGLLGGR